MQVQAAVLTAQNINLRRELGSGWAAADSNVIQVRPAAVTIHCKVMLLYQQYVDSYHCSRGG